MIQASIERVDAQAQRLLESLAASDAVLRTHLDADRLAIVARARAAVEDLRRALLGAQMGPLYWGGEEDDHTPSPGPDSPRSPVG